MDFEELNQTDTFAKPEAGDMCHYCQQGTLVKRTSRYGDFLGCNRYPKCAGKVDIKDEEDDLEKEADRWLEGWGN